MLDPLFWLGLSILLVAVSLAAVLVAALPALRELARAARSAEKLFDTLSRELPPTLESIRLTGMEISDLTDDVSDGVQSAGRVVQQVDQGLSGVRQQARQAKVTTRSIVSGIRTAWRTFQSSAPRSPERLPAGETPPLDLAERNEDEYGRRRESRSERADRTYDRYSDSYDDSYDDSYGDSYDDSYDDSYGDSYDDFSSDADDSSEPLDPTSRPTLNSKPLNGERDLPADVSSAAADPSPDNLSATDPKVLQRQKLPRGERRD